MVIPSDRPSCLSSSIDRFIKSPEDFEKQCNDLHTQNLPKSPYQKHLWSSLNALLPPKDPLSLYHTTIPKRLPPWDSRISSQQMLDGPGLLDHSPFYTPLKPDGDQLFIGLGTILHRYDPISETSPLRITSDNQISAIAVNTFKDEIFIAYFPGTPQLYNQEGFPIRHLPEFSQRFSYSYCASWKSPFEFVLGMVSNIFWIDTRMNESTIKRNTHPDQGCSVECSQKGTYCAIGKEKESVQVFDVRNLREPIFLSSLTMTGSKGLLWLPNNNSILISGSSRPEGNLSCFNTHQNQEHWKIQTGAPIWQVGILDANHIVTSHDAIDRETPYMQIWRLTPDNQCSPTLVTQFKSSDQTTAANLAILRNRNRTSVCTTNINPSTEETITLQHYSTPAKKEESLSPLEEKIR